MASDDRIARLEAAVAEVNLRIVAACRRAGRDPGAVRLVAVTKTIAPPMVADAAAAGIREFGENYVRELETKRTAAPEAVWHFIGRLQGNKVGRVLDVADVVQTLEPGRAARRLTRAAAKRGTPIDCLVEVDFTGRRVGVDPDDALAFVADVSKLEGLRPVGLMTVPPLGEPPRPFFARLRALRETLTERFPSVTELSMGMSADYEDAVEEGATMVRVGTAIFGPRP